MAIANSNSDQEQNRVRAVQGLLVEIEALKFRNQSLMADKIELHRKLNTPELLDFSQAVVLEAAHQRQRWRTEHDAGKEPSDWFWLVGYLAGKALAAHLAGNKDKALHHTISSAAALANWHAAILGANNEMRPGIDGANAAGEPVERG
jgi:hypothetical protein